MGSWGVQLEGSRMGPSGVQVVEVGWLVGNRLGLWEDPVVGWRVVGKVATTAVVVGWRVVGTLARLVVKQVGSLGGRMGHHHQLGGSGLSRNQPERSRRSPQGQEWRWRGQQWQ